MMTMFLYGLRKYGVAILLALFIFFINYSGSHDFDSAMNTTVVAGFFIWLISVIAFMLNKRTAILGINAVVGAINLVKLIWYAVSLQPIRRLIRQLRYGAFTAKPYPFLPLYGSILDTYAMRRKFSLLPFPNKTYASRAALWRLMARGVIGFAYDANQQPGICVFGWRDTPSGGLDQDFERTIYQLMGRCAQPGTIITPRQVYSIITQKPWKNGDKNSIRQPCPHFDEQFLFADLLNTGIGLHSYSKTDITNIFGMKRFLKKLPHAYDSLSATPGTPEISRIWREYMAYAYLFGIEDSTFRKITQMIPATDYQSDPLLYMLQNSEPHAKVVREMMNAVSEATPKNEDVIVVGKGLISAAWHVDEIYDI